MSTSRARLLLAATSVAVLLLALLTVSQVGAVWQLRAQAPAPAAPTQPLPAAPTEVPPRADAEVDLGAPAPPAGVPRPAQRATVDRVVDGDTLRVTVGPDDPGPIPATDSVPVRLLTIDTPETVHPRRPVECGGQEASARAEQLLPAGSTVWLVADVSDTDRFDRYLRAVWTDDGTFVNATLVAEGLAVAARFPPDERWYDELAALEDQARDADRGNWRRCPSP
jgi:micrococcal nuclease